MSDLTQFNGVSHVGRPLQSDIIETSMISYIQWSLLGIGAFNNAAFSASGAFGGQATKLTVVNDPRYTAGKIWQSSRSDWVWETGINYAYQPTTPSGVWVNDIFRPATGVGPYSHTYDYPNGRVIFASGIPRTSNVRMEYSYRTVQVDSADKPWFQTVQFNSFRTDDQQYLQQGSGVWNTLAENRIQLPAVVVQVVPKTRHRPLEIGSTARIHSQEVVLNILAETPWDRKQLHDVFINQYQKRIQGIDKNAVASANKYPLQYNGSLSSGALMYPELIDQYPWRQIRWMDVSSSPVEDVPPLYWAQVSVTAEVDLPSP